MLIALGGVFSAEFNGYFGVVTGETLLRLRADITFVSTSVVSGTQVFHMDDGLDRRNLALDVEGSARLRDFRPLKCDVFNRNQNSIERITL